MNGAVPRATWAKQYPGKGPDSLPIVIVLDPFRARVQRHCRCIFDNETECGVAQVLSGCLKLEPCVLPSMVPSAALKEQVSASLVLARTSCKHFARECTDMGITL